MASIRIEKKKRGERGRISDRPLMTGAARLCRSIHPVISRYGTRTNSFSSARPRPESSAPLYSAAVKEITYRTSQLEDQLYNYTLHWPEHCQSELVGGWRISKNCLPPPPKNESNDLGFNIMLIRSLYAENALAHAHSEMTSFEARLFFSFLPKSGRLFT